MNVHLEEETDVLEKVVPAVVAKIDHSTAVMQQSFKETETHVQRKIDEMTKESQSLRKEKQSSLRFLGVFIFNFRMQ